ncbi:MAG TPA: class I SAM-dependent methyltransferase [Terriglobales bacterium]|nr:class I SAM-dependent methyltransferase [Terriglobales bacterium]
MSTAEEKARVRELAGFYRSGQLDVDRKLIRYRFHALQPHFRPGAFLELGSGDGEMTALLTGVAQHLVVVDGSPELLAELPDAPNLQKICALFEEFEPGMRFNTVIADHVLEHVLDPVALLKRAANWVAPGGRLLVGVPNALSVHRLAAVKMGLLSHPAALNDRDRALGHRRVYTLAELRRDLVEAGLTIAATGGVFLKPLSHAQMQEHWTDAMLAAFFELGAEFPQNAAEIYAACEPPSTMPTVNRQVTDRPQCR